MNKHLLQKFVGALIGVVLSGLVYAADVVEYRNDLDFGSEVRFFMTANPAEQANVDSGAVGRWVRTGYSFRSGGNTQVCRFYGSQNPGPNSHFYTADMAECQGLDSMAKSIASPPDKRWNFESYDFATTTPVNGTCASGLIPVYRAYNNGFARGVDSNHRITSSLAGIAEVVDRGWISEGVVMCAPAPSCPDPQVWNGVVCVYPMGVKVVGANQLPLGCNTWKDPCWEEAVRTGVVKFVQTSAKMTGYSDRDVVFAYFRNTTTMFGKTGFWNFLVLYANDLSPVGSDIGGGMGDEVDWVSGTARGIIAHFPSFGCHEFAWDQAQMAWDNNGTGVIAPVACP